MPQYRYQARHPSGQIRAGILAADSATTAAAILRKQGHHLLQLVPVQAGQAQWANKVKALNYSSGPTQKDILDFTTQLAVMIRAGISLRVALEGIADQVTNPKFKRILLAIKLDVESGKQFSGAIVKYPKLFGPLYVNMVRASEMSGSFAAMLDRIAGYISQQLETRKMVIGASIYPGIIACMAVGVTVFLLTFVLPRFARVFEGKESVLPWPTLFLMGWSTTGGSCWGWWAPVSLASSCLSGPTWAASGGTRPSCRYRCSNGCSEPSMSAAGCTRWASCSTPACPCSTRSPSPAISRATCST
ncbi:MAG: type II secretion system F family protein, partial [Planctomycetota bacterium]